jgi:hypothetical protein
MIVLSRIIGLAPPRFKAFAHEDQPPRANPPPRVVQPAMSRLSALYPQNISMSQFRRTVFSDETLIFLFLPFGTFIPIRTVPSRSSTQSSMSMNPYVRHFSLYIEQSI